MLPSHPKQFFPRELPACPAGNSEPVLPRKVLLFLAVVFTVSTAGALALVVLDLFIARPAAGDALITVLNALAAFLLWRRVLEQSRA